MIQGYLLQNTDPPHIEESCMNRVAGSACIQQASRVGLICVGDRQRPQDREGRAEQ